MSPVSYCTYTVTLAFTEVAIDPGLIPKTSSCYGYRYGMGEF